MTALISVVSFWYTVSKVGNKKDSLTALTSFCEYDVCFRITNVKD